MLAHVGLHQPTTRIFIHDVLFARIELFDEGDVAPRRSVELARIVVRLRREIVAVGGQLIPLFARDFACLTADA
jgi:hypothetical protein